MSYKFLSSPVKVLIDKPLKIKINEKTAPTAYIIDE